jgi:hypothetical protein
MTEILTESYCERCGAKFTFEPPAAGGGPVSRARTIVRGLRNYLVSDSSLDEALAEARREHERRASGAQLQAFHQTFNFCFSCRQYVCADCWNEAAGRCRTCAPMPGVPDPLDLVALERAPDRVQAAAVQAPAPAPSLPTPAQTASPAEASPRPLLQPPSVPVLPWPAEDRPAPATPGQVGAEVPAKAEGEAAEAPVAEAVGAPEPLGAPEAMPEAVPEREATAAVTPEPEAAPGAEAIPETAAQVQAPGSLGPELEPPAEALPESEPIAGPISAPVPETGTAPEPQAVPETVPKAAPEHVLPGESVVEPTPSAVPAEAPVATPTRERPPSAPPVPEIPRPALRQPQPAPAITPWQVVAPDETPAPPARVPSQSASPTTARQAGAGTSMGWLLRRREAAQSQVSARITRSVWEESTRDLVTRPGTGIQACQSCGLPLSANARFCRRCGAPQG